MSSFLIESISGIENIKLYNLEGEILKRGNEKYEKSLKSSFHLFRVENFQSSIKYIIDLIGGMVLLWIGGIEVINNRMSVGELITYNSLLIYFLNPIKELIDLQPQIQTCIISAKRLEEIVSLKTEEKRNKCENVRFDGNINIKDLKFRYGSRKLVLNGITMCIEKGKKVAFVGESGSGKSTLAKILMKMYPYESGHIEINNHNLSKTNINDIRDRITYVSQEVFLFSGSIKENICCLKNGIKFENVVNAAEKAQAHEFIERLPLKYDTLLEENGVGLSTGQRQRISIARGLLKDADIYIFDEVTSNLDSNTEKKINKSINEHLADKTVIYVTHRLNYIKECDKIFVFKEGHIIEEGSHKELLDMAGEYAKLYYYQKQEDNM